MWNELHIHTTTEGSELVSEMLMELGASGTEIVDRSDVPDPGKPGAYWELYDPAMVAAMPEDVLVKAWFNEDTTLEQVKIAMEALRSSGCGVPLGSLKVDMIVVPDEDWGEKWKQDFQPFRIGKHFVIKPGWADYTPQPGDLIIEMEPGMAFGTGTHETTNMCMQLLEKYMQKGMQVMDVGTGSGILAMGAAMLGAGKVLAVDIDPQAVKVAKENIENNHLQDSILVREGDLCKDAAMPCDLAVANIVADAVCMLLEPVQKHLNPGGKLLCSGIMKAREADVLKAAEKANYQLLEKLELGEWVALAFQKGE